MCFFVLNEIHPCPSAASPVLLPTGEKSQPVSLMSPCPWQRGSSEAFLGHFWNICPQTTEAEGQCTNVSQSFSRKSSRKPLDWINQQTMAATLFGSTHSITSWLLADGPALLQYCDSWKSLMLSWLNISVRGFPCGETYVCFRLI